MVLLKISVQRLNDIIAKMLNNQFDCILFIEGNRGSGKSTLAYHIASGVFNRIKTKTTWFNVENQIYFSREEVLQALATKKKGVVWADEMINVAYKRDFFDKDQKTLMKMLDMYRDSCNLFIGCVPKFMNLDTHLRNLVKIRITVLRRGFALLHTQNKTIYNVDGWDTINNQKLEMKWAKAKRPKYTQLSTVQGVITWNRLPDSVEQRYKEVKARKRNALYNPKKTIQETGSKKPIEKLTEEVLAGKITTKDLYLFAKLHDISYKYVRNSLNEQLKLKGESKPLNLLVPTIRNDTS